MHNHDDDYRTGKRGAAVGILTNAVLFVFKLAAGVFGGSHAMIADALHTATDFLTSIGVFIGFKIAQKPPDTEHPYGHGRAESIAAKMVSLVLILGGLKVGYDSIMVIVSGEETHPHMIALWAAVISIFFKEGLFRYAYSLGERIHSNSLKADAWHHRSDALSSIAALIGIGGARLGYHILDPLAGFMVSIFVIRAGIRIFHTAYEELMDAALPKNILDRIKSLSAHVDGVKGIKDVKGRKMGIDIMVDMTIEVNKSISVEAAHKITDVIRRDILRDIKGAKEILIHVEPYQS